MSTDVEANCAFFHKVLPLPQLQKRSVFRYGLDLTFLAGRGRAWALKLTPLAKFGIISSTLMLAREPLAPLSDCREWIEIVAESSFFDYHRRSGEGGIGGP